MTLTERKVKQLIHEAVKQTLNETSDINAVQPLLKLNKLAREFTEEFNRQIDETKAKKIILPYLVQAAIRNLQNDLKLLDGACTNFTNWMIANKEIMNY